MCFTKSTALSQKLIGSEESQFRIAVLWVDNKTQYIVLFFYIPRLVKIFLELLTFLSRRTNYSAAVFGYKIQY
jgi:hypothetical protein